MIADLKPYAEYKESGLPWLGQVPAHWETKRLKNWVTVNGNTLGENTPSDFNFDYLDIGSVTTGRLARSPINLRFADAPSRARRIVVSGDTIVSTVRTYLKAVLTVSALKQPLVASTGFAVLSPRPDTTPRCLGYVAESEAFTNQVTAESVGIAYPAISETRLGNIFVTLPPPSEQAAIVRFLDWANGRLERAIRAKRRVIALLNEQKQAIIHRAVTRGLDPSVPLKDSGVPWLGEIPAHWEVSRIKREFRCLNTLRIPLNSVERGTMKSRVYDYYGASGVIDKVDDFIFNDELLLIAEDGANLLLRNLPLAIIARGKYWVNNHAHILKPRQGNINYLAHVLEGLNYQPWISGAAQPKLTQDRLMSISIAVAPPQEQEAIVKYASQQTHPLVAAISRLEREIELLREYRTRLVADVVTGKLDVREAAARLPDEDPLRDFASSREEEAVDDSADEPMDEDSTEE